MQASARLNEEELNEEELLNNVGPRPTRERGGGSPPPARNTCLRLM